ERALGVGVERIARDAIDCRDDQVGQLRAHLAHHLLALLLGARRGLGQDAIGLFLGPTGRFADDALGLLLGATADLLGLAPRLSQQCLAIALGLLGRAARLVGLGHAVAH